MHGQLGLVLPAHDPIRLAEEIAIADHMLQGRLFVGMARGYQARWQNILCQRFGVTSTASDGSEADQRNRLLFSENFKIMKKAWAKDLLTYDGPTYKVPYPLEGIPNWPPAKTITGRVRRARARSTTTARCKGVSVVPKPYTSAAPAALPGVRRQPGHAPVVRRGERHADDPHGADRDAASCSARSTSEGARVGRARHPRSARASASAGRSTSSRTARAQDASTRRSARACGTLRGAGVARLVRAVRLHGGVAAARRGGPGARRPTSTWPSASSNSGLLIGGTVDDVKRQDRGVPAGRCPIDYFVWLFHWGMIPREEGLPMLELFATEVMPEFGMDASRSRRPRPAPDRCPADRPQHGHRAPGGARAVEAVDRSHPPRRRGGGVDGAHLRGRPRRRSPVRGAGAGVRGGDGDHALRHARGRAVALRADVGGRRRREDDRRVPARVVLRRRRACSTCATRSRASGSRSRTSSTPSRRSSYELTPRDIVMLWTGRDTLPRRSREYFEQPGMTRESTLWLREPGHQA